MASSNLAAQVRERFHVAVPKWRDASPDGKIPAARIYSKAERIEQAKLVEWLRKDDEFLKKFGVYFGYCDILNARGYASKRDLVTKTNVAEWHELVRRNFAVCTIGYIYHDMCCDPETILGEGSGDGYWIYLNDTYLDISSMQVGDAILNLDEVWSVVDGSITEWHGKCLEREKHFTIHNGYPCDRCRRTIYDRSGCRFDVYENLLHCKNCVAECSHWSGKGAKAHG